MSMTKVVPGLFAVIVVAGSCADDGPRAVELPGTPEHPRVIMVEMFDIGFSPSVIDVGVGETVEFDFVNRGAIRHEAVFGGEMVQEDHELEMQQMDDMAMGDDGDGMVMGHDDEGMAMGDDGDGMVMGRDDEGMAMGDDGDGMATDHNDEGVVALAVEPGSTDKVVMSFDTAGHTFIGCHEAGHWAAGMSIDIAVA